MIALLAVIIVSVEAQQAPSYDILIRNGVVYTGDGLPGIKADVGIAGGKIVSVGDLKKAFAHREIDAGGMAVAPGFIDLHAHIESIDSNPEALSALRQGVTTALGGPDGSSPVPLKQYLDRLELLPLGVNVAYLVGHNTVRRRVMGLENREPTAQELREMEAMISQGMQDGAFGISTGLKYLPGTFSKVDEVIALSKVAQKYGGFYTSHLREEGLGLIDGVREAIKIGQEAGIPIVLTHHKVVGKPSWGNSRITLALVDSANQRGLDVQIDQYPYTASFTGLSILIPSWSMAGGNAEFKKRLQTPALRKKIKDEIIFNILNDRGAGDIKNVQLALVEWDRSLEGKSLAEWASQRGLEPTPETGADLIMEAQEKGGAAAIFHAMSDEDVRSIMTHPKTMIASDGRLAVPGQGHPHPRAYGTFPRVLGKFVRQEKVLALEEAIMKMTSLPARRMGLADRGLIREGYRADIVIIDPETVIDKATFSDPHQYPDGIPYVIVNGVISIDNHQASGHFGGRVLRHVLNK